MLKWLGSTYDGSLGLIHVDLCGPAEKARNCPGMTGTHMESEGGPLSMLIGSQSRLGALLIN